MALKARKEEVLMRSESSGLHSLKDMTGFMATSEYLTVEASMKLPYRSRSSSHLGLYTP
jgi:hypothetical protein